MLHEISVSISPCRSASTGPRPTGGFFSHPSHGVRRVSMGSTIGETGPTHRRRGRSGSMFKNIIQSLAALVITVAMVLVVLAPTVAAGAPEEGAYFEYEYEQWVEKGSGAYYGYKETTEGKGRYEVRTVGEEEITVKFKRQWTFDNNEGQYDASSETGIISFHREERYYTSERIDLDDPLYTRMDPEDLAQWIWIPTDVEKGDTIWILDDWWTVTDTDKTLWVGWTPRKLIELTSSGDWSRNDDYGVFEYSYTDRLYFSQDNGMFYAERYEEHDVGTWEGDYATFDLHIKIDVTDASYTPAVDWKEGALTYSFWTFIVVAILGTVFWIGYRARWMTRTNSLHTQRRMETGSHRTSSESVKVKRIRSMDDLPRIKDQATINFEPFLTHMIEKTLLAKGRVALATTMFDDLVGVGLYNREAKVGTIFAPSTEVTETLRKYLGAKDFFSEHKHRITVRSNYYMSTSDKQKLASHDNAAYNVFETHKVYRLDGIRPTSYDPSLVRPMTDADLSDVTRLAKTVYKAPSRKWIRAAHESGDLGYVAEVNGQIVGFGFACVCGDDGRLHTLGVHPDHRGKGIAKELHRARLEAMRRLGVTTVIDEIADWNLASIRISTLSGFRPVGKMWVETVRKSRVKKNIVRR